MSLERRVVLIDNYDSFTFNLVQAIQILGASCQVFRHDQVTLQELETLPIDGLLLGPGPCSPEQAGVTLNAIRGLEGRIPILGVCLGHQAIGHVYGARVVRAERLVHGKTSPTFHDGKGIFFGIPNPFDAGRYNSLLLDPDSLPSCLRVTARSETGEILAIEHRKFHIYGIQFHPESILTPQGPLLLKNWLLELGNREHEHVDT